MRRCLLYVCAPDDEPRREVLDDAIRAEQLVRPTVERCADRAPGPAARALARVPARRRPIGLQLVRGDDTLARQPRMVGIGAARRGPVRRVTTLRMFVM